MLSRKTAHFRLSSVAQKRRLLKLSISELKQLRRLAGAKTSLESKHLRKRGSFYDHSSMLPLYTLDKVCHKWTVWSALEVIVENEKFTVVYSSCR